MRRLTILSFLLLNVFRGAVWPAAVRAQIVPAAVRAQIVPVAGSAPHQEQHEAGQERSPQAARSTEPGLTLEQLQEMALANNPTLAQAKTGVESAAGRLRQAGLWPHPTIGYSGGGNRGGSFVR